jgi:hypothetical protein
VTFFVGERNGFTGSAEYYQVVGTIFDLEVDKVSERFEIDRKILFKGGCQGDAKAVET